MSSDLLENVDDDCKGKSITLTMNAKGIAFLGIMDDDDSIEYILEPNSKGIISAQRIAKALQAWVDHICAGTD